LAASFYGHAASGELHIRPALDLHSAADIATLRAISNEVSELCRRFGGSLAAEHGVGIPRTEYLEDHLGEELMTATRELKELFDPTGVMNPGKIVDTGRFRIDRDLRLGEGSQIDLPFDQQFGWVHKDGSFVGNLEQCNGCAGCLKETPTMCPTYSVTGDELLSTRGRSNVIRAVLDGRLGEGDPGTPGLDEALSSCLACKACRTECPSNVDLAALKAELAHAAHTEGGVPLRDRLIASADWLGRAGSRIPAIANAALTMTSVRQGMRLLFGIDAQRTLPPYAHERFDHWFAARRGAGTSRRGRVVLWDDTWVRYHESHIGQAAVRVLEAAGFEVVLPTGRECCGRPAVSRGLLDKARRLAAHNVALLLELEPTAPVVFLEPSCHSMFVDEYRQFEIPGADRLAERCVLFEELMVEVLREDSGALALSNGDPLVAIHGHCHAKALGDADLLPELAEFIPGVRARLLETGCCGMAGAFGMLEKTVELSTAVARPLVEKVNALPEGTRVVASGTSCRHQIAELTDAQPVHMAELLSDHLTSS
jgi:Fe-S oxidoreductase